MTTEILTDATVREITSRQNSGAPYTERAIQMEQAAQLNRIATVLEKIEKRMSERAAAAAMDMGPW